MLEILPALGYLHSIGLAYNDLKPENIMVTEDQLKLIDLGAVSRINSFGYLYGTPGYQRRDRAPGPRCSHRHLHGGPHAGGADAEPAHPQGPLRRRAARRRPGADGVRLVRRLLRRAIDPDPRRRFGSAEEMSGQLLGVLREVVAQDTDVPGPACRRCSARHVRRSGSICWSRTPTCTSTASAFGEADRAGDRQGARCRWWTHRRRRAGVVGERAEPARADAGPAAGRAARRAGPRRASTCPSRSSCR